MKAHIYRVVSIDPTRRGFAYAILEGKENLLDWGLAQVLIRTDANVLKRVEEILDLPHIELLVVEDGRGSRRRERARRLIRGIKSIAKRRKMPIVFVSRSRVRDVFAPASTKQEIAEAIAEIFPELRSRLPRKRKPWTTEDERMSIFDAVAFVVAALSK